GLSDDGVMRGPHYRGQAGLCFGRTAPLGDVADRGRYQNAFFGLDGRQRDLGRELAAILPAPGQLHPGAHRPGLGVEEVATPMRASGAEFSRPRNLAPSLSNGLTICWPAFLSCSLASSRSAAWASTSSSSLRS